MKIILCTLALFGSSLALAYPSHWWAPVKNPHSWEITPDRAAAGEVILSKRHELGLFSNLAATPFTLDGQRYASLEGLWQSLKFPDPQDPNDPRHRLSGWPATRAQVKKLAGMPALRAGQAANALMARHHIDWISYEGLRFNYRDHGSGSRFHERLIRRASAAKLAQHPRLQRLLRQTRGLKLRPDHTIADDAPPSYRYHLIYQDLREGL